METQTKIDLTPALNWRYAVKKMDASRKIDEAEFQKLLEMARLSPSSYGLQPWKILIVRNEALRKQLRPFCWNQSQVEDASHLLIFAAQTDVTVADVEAYMALTERERGMDPGALKGYVDFIAGKLAETSPEWRAQWAARQAYLALGNALACAAALGIDATPMEGFEPDKVDELLKLSDRGLQSVALLALGFRAEDDDYQHAKKVRKPASDVLIELTEPVD